MKYKPTNCRRNLSMAYVVTQNCEKCKFTDCVAVCPADCFYELDEILVIDPEECVDCDKCVPACPVSAIYSDEDVPPEMQHYIEYNAKEAARLIDEGAEPITEQQDPMDGAEDRKKELGF